MRKKIFENRHKPIVPLTMFIWRVIKFFGVALVLILFSLGCGMLGYRYFEKMSWVDSFVNASMILGGMGPVGDLHTRGGKIFAGFYALYCGMVFIVAIGIIFAPIFHRFLHRFHLEVESDESPHKNKKTSSGR